MNTIRLLKLIDGIIGKAAVMLLPAPARSTAKGVISSLLIIRPGGIGDAVLLAPMIRLFKERYPATEITVLAEQRNAGVFFLFPEMIRVFCYDRPVEFFQVMTGCYDVVIDTEQWHRLSAVVARLIRAPKKIGFSTNQRRRMFTEAIAYSHADYEAISFGHLLIPLELRGRIDATEAPFLTVPPAAARKAFSLTEVLDGKPYIVIFPGASIPVRKWGAERFRQVAERLLENGYVTVVVGSRKDFMAGKLITGVSGLNLAGKTTLVESAAVIEKSRLLISGDSGVLHLAVGLAVPSVSLFGAGIAAKWAPQGENHRVLNQYLPCSPCTCFGTTPFCRDGARCISEITPSDVISAALCLLI